MTLKLTARTALVLAALALAAHLTHDLPARVNATLAQGDWQ